MTQGQWFIASLVALTNINVVVGTGRERWVGAVSVILWLTTVVGWIGAQR